MRSQKTIGNCSNPGLKDYDLKQMTSTDPTMSRQVSGNVKTHSFVLNNNKYPFFHSWNNPLPRWKAASRIILVAYLLDLLRYRIPGSGTKKINQNLLDVIVSHEPVHGLVMVIFI